MTQTPFFLVVVLLCMGNVAFAMSLATMQKLPAQVKAQRIMTVSGLEAILIVVIVALYLATRHGGR